MRTRRAGATWTIAATILPAAGCVSGPDPSAAGVAGHHEPGSDSLHHSPDDAY